MYFVDTTSRGESTPASTSSYDTGLVCMSPAAQAIFQVRKTTSLSARSAWPVKASSIARTAGAVVTVISEK